MGDACPRTIFFATTRKAFYTKVSKDSPSCFFQTLVQACGVIGARVDEREGQGRNISIPGVCYITLENEIPVTCTIRPNPESI